MKRKIVNIDEELCDGCGQCVPSCAEGAIQVIDGKARLISEVYCDGLGACLGECPQGAITIEEREAEDFDESAVKRHMSQQIHEQAKVTVNKQDHVHEGIPTMCPSARLMDLGRSEKKPASKVSASDAGISELKHWPVKLRLVPPQAPFLKDADLMLIADCVPFAFPDLHRTFLTDRSVIIGCPKFDDHDNDLERLTAILNTANLRSLTVVHMEVPCCFGYWNLCQQALKDSGKNIPFKQVIIGIRGGIKTG
ncbi:MAG: 4Fe-4S ferredoxin [Candidatus Schekmanbacteria bacterium RBG_13_48_7]|uniref:4Fe-4S ferredoxin n=1 Tax=Candidatus Schekmanbacteria bacterium RBG_13_48_7 TaxID=1817878 RepID=A0A1F7S340_9BACT|nr:MAG: 4Fe-4S ferredoxin [Candidatus Schekmanbacteria bacterium RBG_13_48_7]